MEQITLTAVPGLPAIGPGDDLGGLIVEAAGRAGLAFQEGDILAVAQKVVSKAEGALVRLAEVRPGPRALEVAARIGKDARLVETILRESREVLKLRRDLIIVVHRLGFVCANAGVDRSNAPQDGGETVTLLPLDPDASARRLRQKIRDLTGQEIGVVVTDSHGRAFREGVLGVAIGVAGLPALRDLRSRRDLFGYEMRVTVQAVADQIAAAATLLMGETNEGRAAILVRGLRLPPDEGSVQPLIRSREKDMFRPPPLW